MAYEWQPIWIDLEDDDGTARGREYLASLRRMAMASINWMAEHPAANPTWREPNRDDLARAAGLPSADGVVFTGAWQDFFEPTNSYARHWFRAMSDACGQGEHSPSLRMMGKAIAAGMLFKRLGWAEFDRFMVTGGEPRH